MTQNMESSEVNLPSNRKFGLFFAGVFLFCTWFFFDGVFSSSEITLLLLAVSILVISIFRPSLLAPVNKIWMRLGLVLGKVVSPIVLGGLFFMLITPVSIIMRLLGRDALNLKMNSKNSHWRERGTEDHGAGWFKNQY